MQHIENMNELRDLITESNSSTHVVLYVTAEWCTVCKRMSPYIQTHVNSKSNMIFAIADYDIAKTIVHKYKIQVVPCFIRFLNGEIETICMSGSEKDISSFFSEF